MGDRHIVLSGCSGGGKSTLLGELERRGFAVVPEPGRRVVVEEHERGGNALPWIDMAAFASRALAIAAEDLRLAEGTPGWVFFDRGLVDAAVALQHAAGRSAHDVLADCERYDPVVFLAPPWPGIYETDGERQHDLGDAIAEYDRLTSAFRELEYETIVVPRIPVGERADFILKHL